MGNYSCFLFQKGSARVNLRKLAASSKKELFINSKSKSLKEACADFILDNNIEFKDISPFPPPCPLHFLTSQSKIIFI
jgi:hypothetical protein